MLVSSGGRNWGVPTRPTGLCFNRVGQIHGVELCQTLRLPEAIAAHSPAQARDVTMTADQIGRDS